MPKHDGGSDKKVVCRNIFICKIRVTERRRWTKIIFELFYLYKPAYGLFTSVQWGSTAY